MDKKQLLTSSLTDLDKLVNHLAWSLISEDSLSGDDLRAVLRYLSKAKTLLMGLPTLREETVCRGSVCAG